MSSGIILAVVIKSYSNTWEGDMEINATSTAYTASSLHKKQSESDILQRSLEKLDTVQVDQKAGEAKQVEQPTTSDKQGRIDFYA